MQSSTINQPLVDHPDLSNKDEELRALTDEEMSDVGGGAFWVPFLVGAALGAYKAYKESKCPPHGLCT